MKMKLPIILAGLAVIVGGAIAVAWFSQDRVAPTKVGRGVASAVAPPEASVAPKVSTPEPETVVAESSVPARTPVQNKTANLADAASTEPPLVINGYEVQDPLARIALNAVGADPEADAYWMGAINDSSLPAEERKDLIEDLNETGLVDPRHPTAQDAPLILSRIRLIEQLMPTAMDDVNRDALAEAYKDLVGLVNGQEPK